MPYMKQKPNNGNQNLNQKQNQERQNQDFLNPQNQLLQKNNNELRPIIAQPKIQTSPSIVAASQQKQKESEAVTPEVNVVNEDNIKQVLSSKGLLPNLSKSVKLSSVPPKTAREHMGENYNLDVFSVIQELEATEQIATELQEQNQQKEDQLVPAQSTERPQQPERPHMHRTPHYNNRRNKWSKNNPQIATPRPARPMPNVAVRSEEPEKPESISLTNEDRPITNVVAPEPQVVPVAVPKEENTQPKTIRRGRKPKSETTASKPVKRITKAKKPATDEE